MHGGHKIVFHTEIYNQHDELLNTGVTTLYFMDAANMKRCDMPALLKEKLAQYFYTTVNSRRRRTGKE